MQTKYNRKNNSPTTRLKQWCTSLILWLVQPMAWAQPTADQIMEDVRGFLGDAAELLAWILLIIAYLVAAYLIIDGALRIFNDREGGTKRFVLGVIVAMIMVTLTTFMITTGQGEIGNIRG
ncbi:MAG: hypothetical protein OXF60_11840 [Gammaproteobacteria bacterium]|nr:hypothetical protein [Gammaproteobacteria bacterium]